jgi:hypothetical protein
MNIRLILLTYVCMFKQPGWAAWVVLESLGYYSWWFDTFCYSVR